MLNKILTNKEIARPGYISLSSYYEQVCELPMLWLFGAKACTRQSVNGFYCLAVLELQIRYEYLANIVFLFLAFIKGEVAAGRMNDEGISFRVLS